MLVAREFVQKHFQEFIAVTTMKQLAGIVHLNNVYAMQRETNLMGFPTYPKMETVAAFAMSMILLSYEQELTRSVQEHRLLSILGHMRNLLTVNVYSGINRSIIYIYIEGMIFIYIQSIIIVRHLSQHDMDFVRSE